MTHVHHVQVSKQAIENAAAFAFQGAPRSYMETEFESDDSSLFQRWIYKVYGYGWQGGESELPLTQLTHDVVQALRQLDVGRVAIVWRRYPETHFDLNNMTTYASMRFAVVDESLCQVTLDLLPLEDGGEYPLLT
jgi:hypothetical protein